MNLSINENIRLMKPYSPPIENRRCFNGLLLDFNEALIPIGPKVQKALIEFVKSNEFQTYPEYGNLVQKISQYVGCKDEEVLITNGSDQAIDIIFRTFTSEKDEVIIPSPSFALFYQCAQLNKNTIITPKYSENGTFPLGEVLDSINKKTKLIVICNPNNPTGTLVSVDDIEKIIIEAAKFNAEVYIDEAYYESSEVTATGLLEKYENLIITRTFSKAFGLASLRIGYVVASKKMIDQMLKVRAPYDVNMIAKIAADSALSDKISMEKYSNEVMNKSKLTLEKFFTNNKIMFLKSRANFILFKLPNANKVFDKLGEEGFRLRLRNFRKNIYLRVTIGTLKQTKQFISVFKNLISKL